MADECILIRAIGKTVLPVYVTFYPGYKKRKRVTKEYVNYFEFYKGPNEDK